MEKDIKWLSDLVQCDLCNHVWRAVYPDGIEKLECPHCHYMVTFEIINNTDE